MFQALLKKQLMEAGAGLLQDKKNGKRRSVTGIVLLAAFYVVLFLFLGMAVYAQAEALCMPLLKNGYGWLYFCLMGLLAVALGVLGSIFNTYSSLYKAKDNELLFSLPIPPSYILNVRLLGVWIWSFLYTAVVFVPTLIVFWSKLARWSVIGDGADWPIGGSLTLSALFGILLLLLLSVFALTLSCILGWVVAKVSVKIKNKSFVVVVLSLGFMVVYYGAYYKAYSFLQSMISNMESVGNGIRGTAYPLYWMGLAGEGEPLSALLFALLIIGIFAVVYLVLSRTFLTMTTANQGTVKKVYKETSLKARGADGALLWKEWKHFTASPIYLLNCGFGMFLIPVAGIVVLVKMNYVQELMEQLPGEMSGLLLPAVCLALCAMSSMNDITAPSVSLEGKNLWLLQSLPLSPWQALAAKLKLHMLCSGIPIVFCGICFVIALRPGLVGSLLLLAVPLLYVLMFSAAGLAVNLKVPNLNWTNEVAPVKQSLPVAAVLFGGMFFSILLVAPYLILQSILPPEAYLALCGLILAGISAFLLRWLKTRGAKLLAEL